MPKRRVLVLEQQSYRGGAQRVLEVVLDALREQIDPIVAFPESGPFLEDLRKQGIETLTFALGRYRSGRKSAADLASFVPRSLYGALELARTILRRQVDLVYINGPRCLLAGAWAARITRRPSLFCLHNTLSGRPEVTLAAHASSLVSRIVACSRATAAPLLRVKPAVAAKMEVLYPPVSDVASAGPQTPRGAGFMIGMVGRITEGKGHRVLLDALTRLDAATGVRLVIVGAPAPGNPDDARYLRELRSFAVTSGLDRRIDWAGYKADPRPYYGAMDALAVPSVCEEGMPVVALEAFQRGIPVIASRTGGIPELIRDGVNGLLVAPRNPAELALAMGSLQHSPALCARLGAAARASVDARFSPASYCSALGKIISDLCSLQAPVKVAAAWGEIRG